jgi:hypothetical protein
MVRVISFLFAVSTAFLLGVVPAWSYLLKQVSIPGADKLVLACGDAAGKTWDIDLAGNANTVHTAVRVTKLGYDHRTPNFAIAVLGEKNEKGVFNILSMGFRPPSQTFGYSLP